MRQQASAFSPASVGNVGVGFDILGHVIEGVGDTVTGVEDPCSEPLPGYKAVQPMVYSGVYPADGSKYGDLRDALEKLKLNDASMSYTQENSIALGFGFRVYGAPRTFGLTVSKAFQ